MARPSKAIERFVMLYVNGPNFIRGQWEACANAAGLKVAPSRQDVMVRNKIEALGGVVAEFDAPVLDPVAQLETLGMESNAGIPWTEIRDKLSQVIIAVANGTVQARASQVAMINKIVEKAEQEQRKEEIVHSVIVLPVQGMNAEMRIDTDWLKKLQSVETPNMDEVT